MAYGTNQGTKLVGYCESSSSEISSLLILLDFTGASNATFSLSLSLVTGNVGGNTKKMVSGAGLTNQVSQGADCPGRLSTRLHRCRPWECDRSIRILRISSTSLHNRCDRLHDLPYRRGMSPLDPASYTYTQIVVILVLRLAFVIPNKLRDKKFAEGDVRYDPNVITYEDMTDKQNLHFRYLSTCPLPFL